MLNNPYFFITVSFVIFLLVGYKKIWPDIVSSLIDDIKKIKEGFETLKNKKKQLQADINILKAEGDAFQRKLKKIHQNALDHAESIKDVYIKSVETLSHDQNAHINKIYLRLVQRFESDSLKYFSQIVVADLNSFFDKYKNDKNFHKDALHKSFVLLKKTS